MFYRVIPYSLFTAYDIYLFKQGAHFQLFDKLGAHILSVNGEDGVYFAVWAPGACRVSVIGDFNGWNHFSHPLLVRWDEAGIWEGFIPHMKKGDLYKYCIFSSEDSRGLEKGDPFALLWESPPKTASIVWDLSYEWQEEEWEKGRKKNNSLHAPISIYEIHFGSWRKKEANGFSLSYREMAEILPTYINDMGFTHVEFLPIMEHPFYGSWGYQKVGYFAPSSRYGTPQDFMRLIESLHQHNIGVILDWVPSHFPADGHGLSFFDGTHLFEHQDSRQGFHPEWNSLIFNYGRHEVRAFLISSAVFWLKKYHVDGLRVDGVSSMLYLDYCRKEGQWIQNRHGGKENLEAISFIKQLTEYTYCEFPHTQIIAEESTAWPLVSRPTYLGGLGFGMKWNMGWMHDVLNYFCKDPIFRKYHHNDLLFSWSYIFQENFILSLSHDEVVYGKRSFLNKMPGDEWQKFANLRLLYSYMFAHSGKKLLFMGGEIAQWNEWNHDTSLDWHLLAYSPHKGVQKLVCDLNCLYRKETALHILDFHPKGYEWIDLYDSDRSIVGYLRTGIGQRETVLVVCNFTPVPRYSYRITVPYEGWWKEIFNSDSLYYGGSNVGNQGMAEATCQEKNHRFTLSLTLPPLGAVMFKPQLDVGPLG